MAAETPIRVDLDEGLDPHDGSALRPRGRHRLAEPERRPMAARPRLLGVVAVAVALVAAGLALLIPADDGPGGPPAAQRPAGQASAGPSASGLLKDSVPGTTPVAKTLVAGPVTVDPVGFFSWALLDEHGKIFGSSNITSTSWPGSMLNVWIVSDFLRRRLEWNRQPTTTELTQASRAIRDSDEQAAERLYRENGGPAQMRRMTSICGLTDTLVGDGHWRDVQMSARDVARLGRCVTDGRAAGPFWTEWVRTEMTKVRGTVEQADQPWGGRWGIIDALPADLAASGVGIKNGWIVGRGGNWQVNCLAVADTWSLAVLLRYPAERGLRYGAGTCAQVASQLLAPAN